jgi:hypothetical protein
VAFDSVQGKRLEMMTERQLLRAIERKDPDPERVVRAPQ